MSKSLDQQLMAQVTLIFSQFTRTKILLIPSKYICTEFNRSASAAYKQ